MRALAKYNASGNDFVIFHSFTKRDYSQDAIELCNRNSGIGADGLIVLVPHETYDFEWLFYNDDGSSAQMCGNGSRACAHYAYTRELAPSSMSFLTIAGVIKAKVEGNLVTSDLTPPIIHSKEIQKAGLTWWKIDTGVPHLITFVEDIDNFDLKLARELRDEHNTNVNIAKVLEDGSMKVRTYERGVENETQACGTGMASAFYRANQEGLVKDNAKVYPTSGELLELALVDGKTITFKGAVQNTFNTFL